MVQTLTPPKPMIVEFKHLAAQRTASVHIVRSAARLPSAFGEFLPVIGAVVERTGGRFSGPPFLLYRGSSAGKLDVEIGMPVLNVPAGLPRLDSVGEGRVGASELPGGRVASWIYRGPYAGLGDAWACLEEWLSKNDHAVADGCWESYVDNPDLVPTSELRTELFQTLRAD